MAARRRRSHKAPTLLPINCGLQQPHRAHNCPALQLPLPGKGSEGRRDAGTPCPGRQQQVWVVQSCD